MSENENNKIEISKTPKEKAYVVLQKHAAILREGLAFACKKAHPLVRPKLIGYLTQYANAVKEYCECPQQSWVPKEGPNTYACLDCGKRVQKEKAQDQIVDPNYCRRCNQLTETHKGECVTCGVLKPPPTLEVVS